MSGYSYIDEKGRIPGSVWGNCGSDAYPMEHYRILDHTTRESGEIVAAWRDVGVTPGKHNAAALVLTPRTAHDRLRAAMEFALNHRASG